MIEISKFDGAGNDFVLIDGREGNITLTPQQIAGICHRRFGVGADGLMLLEEGDDECDFKMRYFNSDGNEATMCGNGGRCIALFAHLLGVAADNPDDPNGRCSHFQFKGPDGMHSADILLWDEDTHVGLVRLGMCDVVRSSVQRCLDGWFLDTGSPHYVQRVQDLEHFDVVGEGRRIRNMEHLFPQGTNVDFVQDADDGALLVRTYERGVEDETWACGTGVTAAAIVTGNGRVKTRGGDFRVTFETDDKLYKNIILTGPVSYNFFGSYNLS